MVIFDNEVLVADSVGSSLASRLLSKSTDLCLNSVEDSIIWDDSDHSSDFAVITEVEVEVVANDADFAGETSGTAAIEDKVGKNTNDKKHPIIPIFDTKIIVMPILCYF